MNAGITLATWFKGEARRVTPCGAKTTASEPTPAGRMDRPQGWNGDVREVQQGCRWLREPRHGGAALENW